MRQTPLEIRARRQIADALEYELLIAESMQQRWNRFYYLLLVIDSRPTEHGGQDSCGRLLARRPGLPVISTDGWSNVTRLSRRPCSGFVPGLGKPGVRLWKGKGYGLTWRHQAHGWWERTAQSLLSQHRCVAHATPLSGAMLDWPNRNSSRLCLERRYRLTDGAANRLGGLVPFCQGRLVERQMPAAYRLPGKLHH